MLIYIVAYIALQESKKCFREIFIITSPTAFFLTQRQPYQPPPPSIPCLFPLNPLIPDLVQLKQLTEVKSKVFPSQLQSRWNST